MATGSKGLLAPKLSPVEQALALGSAPDPRTDPEGYASWYASAQKAANNLMGYRTPEEQASLANFYKQLGIGEGLMQNTASYGYAQGADTSGTSALTNFLDNYMPDSGKAAYDPSHNWVLDQALSGTPGYSFADRYIQRTAAPESLNRSEGIYELLPGQQYRVTDLNGNVIYTGTDASKIGNDIVPGMRDKGYTVQMSNPETGDWSVTQQYVPDPDPLGQFALMAAPMLGSALLPFLAPGFMGLGQAGTAAAGAALGSAGAGIATGQGVGDILKNAALSAGLAYAGNSLAGGNSGIPAGASDAAISANVANAINTAYTGAQLGTAAALAPVYGGALAGTGGLLSAAAPVLSEGASLAPQALSSLPSNLSAVQAASDAYLSGAGLGGGIASGAADATDALISQNTQNAVDTAYFNAQQGAAGTLAPVYGAGATTAAAGAGGGLLSKPVSQWSLGDWYNAASLGSGILGGIIGSGSQPGTGTATGPYTSPFGNLGSMAGKDMRATPSIANYETYGFGPEATFFKPEYGQIVSGALSSGSTTPTIYKPLING